MFWPKHPRCWDQNTSQIQILRHLKKKKKGALLEFETFRMAYLEPVRKPVHVVHNAQWCAMGNRVLACCMAATDVALLVPCQVLPLPDTLQMMCRPCLRRPSSLAPLRARSLSFSRALCFSNTPCERVCIHGAAVLQKTFKHSCCDAFCSRFKDEKRLAQQRGECLLPQITLYHTLAACTVAVRLI